MSHLDIICTYLIFYLSHINFNDTSIIGVFAHNNALFTHHFF